MFYLTKSYSYQLKFGIFLAKNEHEKLDIVQIKRIVNTRSASAITLQQGKTNNITYSIHINVAWLNGLAYK